MTISGKQLRIVYKNPCRLATTTNVANLAAGAPNTVDGVAVLQNDRILVASQTAGAENGIYFVSVVGSGANGTWIRTLDFYNAAINQIEAGTQCWVQEGHVYAQRSFILKTTGIITIGVTSLNLQLQGLPSQEISVALDAGDFNSIEDGLARAASIANTNNRVAVRIAPGDYYENTPLTVPDYVTVYGSGHEVCRIFCLNNGPAQHGLIMGTDTEVFNLQVRGASGAGAGGFYFPSGKHDMETHDCKYRDCDIGFFSEAGGPNPAVFVRNPHCSGGSGSVAYQVSNGGRMTVTGAVQTGAVVVTDTFAKADGAGSKLTMCVVQLGGTNTQRTAEVSNNAEMELQVFRVDGCAEGWFVLGSGGALSLGSAQMTNVAGDTLNLANAVGVYAFANDVYFDDDKLVKGANAFLSGIYEAADVSSRPGPTAIGEFWLGTDPAAQVPLSSYIRDTATTGYVSGGTVSVNAGRTMDVAAGVGYVNTGVGVVKVEWTGVQVVGTASSDFWVYVTSAGVVSIATSQPDPFTNVILSGGYCNATDVILLSAHVIPVEAVVGSRHEYTAQVIGSIWLSGLATTLPGLLEVEVGSGSYYRADVLKNATGSAPITFTYWRTDGAGGWTVVPGQTDIDNANFDDGAGGLTGLAAGNYKKDIVYVNTHNGNTEYHVVYARSEQVSQVLAEGSPEAIPPTLFSDTSIIVSGVVSQQGNGTLVSVVDLRPAITAVGPGAGAPAADHGALTGLGDDDHPQYIALIGNAARNPLTGTLDASGGVVLLPTSAAPSQTADGQVVWDSAGKLLTMGDGAARKTFADTTTTQSLSNKSLVAAAVPDHMDYAPVSSPPWVEGRVFYDNADKTLAVHVEGNSTLQIGQESFTRCRNNTGGPLADGTVVYVSGATSSRPTIDLADASSGATTEAVIGVLTQAIADGTDGSVTLAGLVRDINTTGGAEAWSPGDPVYLSSTTPGGLTNVPVISPSHLVRVGYVLVADAVNGILLVAISYSSHLEDLHDVLIVTPLDKQVLEYETATALWKNATPPVASTILAGAIEIATQAEVDTGTDPNRAVTPATLASAATVIKTSQAAGGDLGGTYPNPTVVAASTTLAGKIEIATQAEVNAGVDPNRAVTPATLASHQVFGRDFQQVAAETVTTTAVGAYSTKVTLTTGALTGTYRVAYSAEVMGSVKDKQMPCRLYNVTDAVEYCFDSGDKEEANQWEQNAGFVYVTLAGASKDIAIQFASPELVTVSCRRARIEFWRVA